MPDSQPRGLRKIREIRRSDILLSVDRVPDSEKLLVGSSQGKVFEIDASQNNPRERELANHGRYVTSVRLVRGKVISGAYDGRLIWWDLEGNREIRTINAHTRWIRHIAVSPDQSKIASVADDMVCRIWDAQTGEEIRAIRGHAEKTPTHFDSMLYTCRFSGDGRFLATADRVGKVFVWEVSSGDRKATLDASGLYTWDGRQRIRSIGGARSLAFSPDGNHLAVGGVGRIGNVDSIAGKSRVEVFDWKRGQRAYVLEGNNGMINRLEYHPRNNWICGFGGRANGIALFGNPQDRNRSHQSNLPMHVHDAVFSDDHAKFYAVGHQKVVVYEVQG